MSTEFSLDKVISGRERCIAYEAISELKRTASGMTSGERTDPIGTEKLPDHNLESHLLLQYG